MNFGDVSVNGKGFATEPQSVSSMAIGCSHSHLIVAGSSPAFFTIGKIAQLVERLQMEQEVITSEDGKSSPRKC